MTTVHRVVLAGFVAVLALALTSRSRPRRGAPPVAVPNLRFLRSAGLKSTRSARPRRSPVLLASTDSRPMLRARWGSAGEGDDLPAMVTNSAGG